MARLFAIAGVCIDAAGNPVGRNGVTPGREEFRVNTETDDDQSVPSVTVLADGSFVVVWMSEYQDGSGDGIYAQHFNADGSPRSEEFRVNTETYDDQGDLTVAALADGGYVVAWESESQDGDPDQGNNDDDFGGVYAQRYNADASKNGGEF